MRKEFAEPDFREVQRFATNEFFEQLPPNEQQIVAGSYLRVERQTASPAEMLVVKKYFERAKAADVFDTTLISKARRMAQEGVLVAGTPEKIL